MASARCRFGRDPIGRPGWSRCFATAPTSFRLTYATEIGLFAIEDAGSCGAGRAFVSVGHRLSIAGGRRIAIIVGLADADHFFQIHCRCLFDPDYADVGRVVCAGLLSRRTTAKHV